VVALVVAVGAFLLLKNGDDNSSNSKDTTAQTGTTNTTTPSPKVTTITIKDGKPVGGVQNIEVNKGDLLEYRVKSDADHEIHMHGYDIAKDVSAGGSVTYKLKANIDGIFEIEIEDLGEQIAELRVNP
jgi:hypothetical protein